MIGGGYNGHPGIADGQRDGKQLADYIKSILPSTSISEIVKNKTDFSVFPNPTKNSINIKGTIKANLIEISDSSGKIVKTIKVSLPGEVDIDVSQLNAGIYIFSTINDNGLKIIRKVYKL